jgi:hypothetical protein
MPENIDDHKSYMLHEIVQPLLDLETPQEVFERIGNLLVEYLGMDLAAIGETHQNSEFTMLAYAFPDTANNQVISSLFPAGDQESAFLPSDETTSKFTISQSLETGLPTTQHISVPHPLSLACLPINYKDPVNLVLIVGLRNQQHFPEQLLQLCLVIAGLVRSNLIHLSYKQDLQTIQGRLQQAQEIGAIGKEYQIAYSAVQISDSNGNISGAVLVFRDGSEEYRILKPTSHLLINIPSSLHYHLPKKDATFSIMMPVHEENA